MGRVDRWWNEHFPPFSWRRLAFAIAFIPITSLLWWVLAEEVITWPRYIVITLMTQAFFTAMYVMARARRDEIDELKASGEAFEWPVRRTPPPRDPGPDVERELMLAAWEPQKKPRISRRLDFMLSFALSFGTFTALLFIFVPDAPVPYGVTLAAGTALIFTAALIFRYSIVFMVGLSILLGYPLAQIGRGLYSVMSFFSDPGPLVIWWPLTSVGIFTFLAPGWMWVRNHRHVFQRLRIPNWFTTALTCAFLLVSTAMVTYESDVELESATPPAAPVAGEGGSDVVSNFGTPTREEAALRLFFAWRNGDRTAAGQVAHAQVARELLGFEFDPSSRLLGCGVADGRDVCAIRRTSDLVVLTPQVTNSTRFFIAAFEFAPLDHPVDYSKPEPTATVAGP